MATVYTYGADFHAECIAKKVIFGAQEFATPPRYRPSVGLRVDHLWVMAIRLEDDSVEFINPPKVLSSKGTYHNFNYSTAEKAWYLGMNINPIGAVTSVIIETRSKATPVLTVTNTILNDLNIKNSDLYINNVKAVLNSTANKGDTLEIRCRPDYIFLGDVIINDNVTMVKNESNNIATLKYESDTAITGFNFNSTIVLYPVKTITQDDINYYTERNVKLMLNDLQVSDGDIVYYKDKLDFICDLNYFFVGDVYVNETIAVKNSFNNEASLIYESKDPINLITFESEFIDPRTVVYIFDEENLSYFTERFTTVYADDVLLGVGSKIYDGQEITIKCNNKYEFLEGQPVRIHYVYYIDMPVSEDRKTSSILYTIGVEIVRFDFRTVLTDLVNTNTTNNTYEITPREFRNLETMPLKVINTSNEVIYDYTSMLIGVMKFPFKIPDDVKGELDSIYLGSKEFTQVQGNDISKDIIMIDLGTIYTEPKYNDMRDFDNTVAILRLPQLSSVALDVEYVVGQTIGIKYWVNLVDGSTKVIITSDKLQGDSDTLLTLDAVIGSRMPIAFKQFTQYAPVDKFGVSLGGINEVFTPTLDIVRSDLANVDDPFSAPIADSGLLKDVSGWVKVSEMGLTISATKQERDEILSLLSQGIFIND